MTYKLLNGSESILRIADGACITNDPANSDYQQYLRWRDGYTETPIIGYQEITDADGNVTLEPIYGPEIVHPPHTPEPADVPSLESRQDAAWLAIQSKRAVVKSSGVLVAGKWFHSDADSRIQQIGLVMMGAALPAVQWKTMNGTFITMTPTLAGGIFQAVAGLDMQAFAAAETHKAAMMLSTTPDNYDFSQGWPEVFGG